jgi:mono/diheme cytochrome c family protein
MKILITVLATLLVGVASAIGYVLSGSYNVAATVPHTGASAWILHELKERSIESHARDTGSAPTDSVMVARGFHEFEAMCETCHGAPGVDPSAIGRGMLPEPPELDDATDEFTDGQLFWILKHGIKLAGMPAFGPTHSDSTLWGIVGAMREMRGMTAEEYQARIAAAAGTASEHTDPAGTPSHSH